MSSAQGSKAVKLLSFQIAGIPFSVLSDSPQHDGWLSAAYRQFHTSEKPGLNLAIRTRPRRSFDSLAPERIRWNGSRWTLESKLFRITEAPESRGYRAETASSTGIGDLMRTWFSYVLLSQGGVLLHATAVVRSGKALVFAGPSGSGKTTLARLAGRQPVLSDESVVITRSPHTRRGKAVFYAHGTPFFGELMDAAVNKSAPIGEVFLIRPPNSGSNDDSFRLTAVSPSRSMAELLSQTFLRVLSRNSLEILLSFLGEFTEGVRIRRLEFAPTPQIWKFIDDQSG